MSRPAAILIGPPGAGKSTVGPLLGALLGVGFTDTDSWGEVIAGKPVSDIFIEDGEAAFRALERAAVASAIAAHRGVVGLGGGAVLDLDRKSVVQGKSVDLGGRRIIKKTESDTSDLTTALLVQRAVWSVGHGQQLGRTAAEWSGRATMSRGVLDMCQ